MSDGFNSQLNAFLAAAVAQQQKQQQQQQTQSNNSNSNQMPLFGLSQTQMLAELQKHQQTLNQFNLNQQQQQNPLSSSAAALQMGMLGGLNEPTLQSLLLSQSLQKLNQSNQMQQNPRSQTSLLPNQQTFGQMPLIPNDQLNQFRNNDNSIMQSLNDFGNMKGNSNNFNYNNNNTNQRQQQQRHQQQQQQEPQTRELEPYFPDDSPFNSLDQQIGISDSGSASQNQIDMFSEFKRISLNESTAGRGNNNSNNNELTTNNNVKTLFVKLKSLISIKQTVKKLLFGIS